MNPSSDSGENSKADTDEGRSGTVGEFVKKAAVAGLGALFMTEEGLRGLAGQLKLPKEMLGFALAQAERTKEDLQRVLTDELQKFLRSDRLKEELTKLMSGMTIDLHAQIRLVPDKGPVNTSKVLVAISRKGKRV